MNSIGRRTLRWLLVAMWLTSTMLHAGNGETNPTPLPSEPEYVSVSDCVAEAEAVWEEERAELLEGCESDCNAELDRLRGDLDAICDRAEIAAVATERRHYEPLLAASRTKAQEWEREAESRAASEAFWRGAATLLALIATGAVVYAAVK